MLIALSSYVVFSVGDGLVRSMAGQWPGSGIATLRYTIGAIVLGVILAIREGRKGFRCPMPWTQVGRGAAIALMTICFFTALGFMPLADTTAVQFTTPMWAVLMSAALLGERIDWRKAVLILIAFAGALIVLRPNLLALGFAAILPLAGALLMAVLMMFNRRIAETGSVLSNQFFGAGIAVLFMVPITLGAHFAHVPRFVMNWPSAVVILKCLAVAVTGTSGHLLLYLATERASAADVAPMSYVQIVTAGLIGWLAFGAVPSWTMVLGSLVIVCAGLLLFRISRDMARDVSEAGTTPD
jgi:drug/metabolite transporter (DMT)-like permease